MTNDQIRRKIAEACGWENIREVETSPGLFELVGQSPARIHPDLFDTIPNYPESHDAMHEALPLLDKDERPYYIALMEERFDLWRTFDIHTATPIQKAEAFLKAKGLWEEGE